MQGLMLKLLNVDAAGERALRVVAYFDQLAANNPDLDSVVRATALIADCTAGLELTDRGIHMRFSTEGTLVPGSGNATEQTSIAGDSGAPGSVWLEREGAPRELDEFIVERFALTVSTVLMRQRPAGDLDLASGFADPALAQMLVNERVSEAERSRAARLMGLQSSGTVQLIAVEPGENETLTEATASMRDAWGVPLYASELSQHLGLIVAVTREPLVWQIDHFAGRAASGPLVELLSAPRSWAIARETLRFAGAGSTWPRTLDSGQIGVLRLLGQLDPSTTIADPDVTRIERVAVAPGGAESIAILDHFLHSDSLRSAARASNYHHSSLQSRIARLGSVLEIDLKTPAGRERATLALLLWRIFRTA